jgi:hypothetical protein
MNYRLTVHVENQPKVDTNPVTKKREKGPMQNEYQRVLEQSAKDREAFAKGKGKGKGAKEDNKGRYKVYTTLSFYHKTKEDCMKQLADVRTKYDVALGKDINKPKKYNKELYNISFIK